ncbi:MAG: hypothetical protein MI784_02695 [Cytophagales bacterium]|nr:hypothetical protein [Cytophagales bacterium]
MAKRSGEAGMFYDVLLCNYGNLQFVSKIQSNGISELVRLISHNMFIRDQYNVQVGMTVKALKKKRQAMESKMENGQLLYFQRGSHIGYLMSAGPQGVIVGEASEGMLEVEAIVWSESRWDAN